MTTQELLTYAADQWLPLLSWFIAVPACAFLTGLCHKKGAGGGAPWRYIYSVLVYLSTFPGILAAILTAYSLFLVRQNLLEANVLVYFLPIVSMGVTFGFIRARVDFDEIPGFDRIAGLMTMVALTFLIILAIEKTRIWLFFAGSIARLIALLVGVFALLKWSAYALFRRSDEPKVKAPSFPNQG